MLYQPKLPDKMWDCTMYYEAPVYHIFYLSSGNIGHVATQDFVTFDERPKIECFGPAGAWNERGVPLTGTVAKVGDSYRMLLGTIEAGSDMQVYGLYLSDDLDHWTQYGHNPVLRSDGKLYEREVSTRDWSMYTAWRDPNVYAVRDGWYYLCLCARLKAHAPESTGAAIANLRTRDFIDFEILPPLAEVGTMTKYAECPDCFEAGGKRFVTFLDHAWGGLRVQTETRRDAAGTFYLGFDEKTETFLPGRDPLLLGSANNRQCAWAARTVVGEDGKRLLFFHVTAERPTFGPPKLVEPDGAGGLLLKYFDKLDGLRGGALSLESQPVPDDCGTWSREGDAFSGEIPIYGSALPVAEASQVVCDCEITLKKGDKAGIAFWHAEDEAVCVWLDAGNRRIFAEWEHYRAFEGFGDLQEDVVNGGLLRERDEKSLNIEYGRKYRVKVLAKDRTVDVYLDDVWVICKRFPMAAEQGTISLLVEKASADFKIKLNEMK